MNEIGKRKLDTKSTICASSLGGADTAGAACVACADGCDVVITTGVDCIDTPDMDTAESTCSE